MTSALIPSCSFWALRFETAGPSQGMPDDAKAASTITGPSRPRRPRAGWAMTGLRRVIGAFRHANSELVLAMELLRRPVGAPRTRPSADPLAAPDTHQAATGGRANRAA